MNDILKNKILNYLKELGVIDESNFGTVVKFDREEYPEIFLAVSGYVNKNRNFDKAIQRFIDDWDNSYSFGEYDRLCDSLVEELGIEDDDFDEVNDFLLDVVSTYPTSKQIKDCLSQLDVYLYLVLDSGDYNTEFVCNGDIIQSVYDNEIKELDKDTLNRSSLNWLLGQHGVNLIDLQKSYIRSLNYGFPVSNSITDDISWELSNMCGYRICKLFFKIKMSVEDYCNLKKLQLNTLEFFDDNDKLSGKYLLLPCGTEFGFGDEDLGWASIFEASTKKELKIPIEMVHNLIINRADWYKINNTEEIGLYEIGEIENFSKLEEN